jgi:hypothetical protein
MDHDLVLAIFGRRQIASTASQQSQGCPQTLHFKVKADERHTGKLALFGWFDTGRMAEVGGRRPRLED